MDDTGKYFESWMRKYLIDRLVKKIEYKTAGMTDKDGIICPFVNQKVDKHLVCEASRYYRMKNCIGKN